MRVIYFYLLVVSFSFIYSDEFNQGPYGTGYFDTAGPFEVEDLNLKPLGDINNDSVTNIQDIIMLVQYVLGNSGLSSDQIIIADTNEDGSLNVMDIVFLVGYVLDPPETKWNFEDNWLGNESYIFIQKLQGTGVTLWNATNADKLDLLNKSPDNVHYFFVSSYSTHESDIINQKNDFDEILSTLNEEQQAHWNSHLHFIPTRTYDLDSWLVEALAGNYAIAIDQFQEIRQIGYLGNPANFTGTYLEYIAHEAIYFDYEHRTIKEPNVSYDEIVIFDEELYTGGWAASISKVVSFPSNEQLSAYHKMSVELLRGCPDGNGGYSDQGCDDYDRIAHMYICDEDGSNCHEISRWITPFDRQPHSLTDITPFIASLRPGGDKTIKFQESGWPNSLLTLKIRLYDDVDIESTPIAILPIWNGTVQFNPDYSDNRPMQIFEIPSDAQKVEFVSFITGHGWGCTGCYNCAEFCNSRHIFNINEGIYEFDKSHPTASSNNHCMQPETIAEGVVPNQYGTWGYGRAGWCPGQDVAPYRVDITNHVNLGEPNTIDYDACRVSGNSCITPPTCPGDGCYCPEIAMSSYIVIYNAIAK